MTVAEITALILQLGPIALEFFIKIESLLNLGPDEKANIASAIASANSSNADTQAKIAAWMQANGFTTKVTFVKAN